MAETSAGRPMRKVPDTLSVQKQRITLPDTVATGTLHDSLRAAFTKPDEKASILAALATTPQPDTMYDRVELGESSVTISDGTAMSGYVLVFHRPDDLTKHLKDRVLILHPRGGFSVMTVEPEKVADLLAQFAKEPESSTFKMVEQTSAQDARKAVHTANALALVVARRAGIQIPDVQPDPLDQQHAELLTAIKSRPS